MSEALTEADETVGIIPQELQVQSVTPMEMLQQAVSGGADPETLEKLMTLHERWQAQQDRKSFVASMAKARAEFLPVYKQTSGYLNRYKFEQLSNIADAVDPALAKYGFSYEWVTEDLEEGRVRVTCVVTHEEGHEKRNSLSGHPENTADEKANMNEFQRLGGAVTYLQRYTLKSALGIAASADTDAGGASSAPNFDTGPWIARIDDAFKNKDQSAVKAIKADIQKEAKENRMPDASFKLLNAHYSAQIKRAKELSDG